MEQAVCRQLYWQAQLEHLLEGIFARSQWHLGVELDHGDAQALDQDYLTVVVTLRAFAVIGDSRPVQVGVAHICQPAEGFLFQLVFGHTTSPPVFSSPASAAR
ncbi:hypothetical protein D3C80_844830 [compost metagenome]